MSSTLSTDSTDAGVGGPGLAMHEGQLDITAKTVELLLRNQFPDLAHHAVRRIRSHGTVNMLFRVGDHLLARFPLNPSDPDDELVVQQAEAAAAAELAGRTPFATPLPVAIGQPGHGFPLPWSIQTWVAGHDATVDDPATSDAFAEDLARFIHGVRAIDVRGRRFSGSKRGGELASQDEWMEICFDESAGLLDVEALRDLWSRLRVTARANTPDVMNHGDLMPGNVLVRDGRLSGIIDVGDLGPADPALDVLSCWHLLDAGPRQVFRGALACDDEEWARGMGWAFAQSMGLVWYYRVSNPVMAQIGRRTLDRLLEAIEP